MAVFIGLLMVHSKEIEPLPYFIIIIYYLYIYICVIIVLSSCPVAILVIHDYVGMH